MTKDKKNSNESDVTIRTQTWQDDAGKCHAKTVSRQSTDEPEFPDCGWRPIETAPKDGTEIDLWVIDTSGSRSGWRRTEACWFENDWTYDKRDIDESAFPIKVTHWMPLPAPPEQK